MNKLFFELIRIALGKAGCLSHTPTEKEWYALYEMAEKQALTGICFAGVERTHTQGQMPPMDLLMDWLGQAEYIKTRNEEVNEQCVQLQSRLSKADFKRCVLKGQAIARLYKTGVKKVLNGSESSEGVVDLSLLRQSGDIDVWLSPSTGSGTNNREQIMAYVNKVSPTDDVRWLHTQMKVFETTEVEVHFLPSYLECPWQDKALQRFFESEKEACFANGRATDKFNQVFILAHAFRHVFSEGVGLRQLMDYYFVLRNSKERLTREEFCKVMNDTGMMRFAKAVMWIMQEAFGLEELYLLCEPSAKDGRFLLNEVMQSGNFGHQDERVQHVAGESALHRFWRIAVYNCRVVRFSPWIVICSPIWRLWHWCWRKRKGYK